MATYKVIQDIEAEDKFVGPLTLKQFVFAMGGTLFGYLTFIAMAKGLAVGAIVTLPPCLFGFFMAIPWSKEQSTDVWVLAKIRFRLKSRKRLWDQEGMQELVKITAPKKEEKHLTKDFSQTEVRSRLKALAETIDSRGWSIKNSPLQDSFNPPDDDRLINVSTMPAPETAEETVPDMMEKENPNLDSMIKQSDQDRKTRLYEKMEQIRNGEEPQQTTAIQTVVAPPIEAEAPPAQAQSQGNDEQALLARLKASREAGDIAKGNMHAIPSQTPVATALPDDTASDKNEEEQKTEVEKAQAPMTEQAVPDILELARNNDLNIATIARQANTKETGYGSNEVVISLH